MKQQNNPKDTSPHAPGRGSDKQHPNTPIPPTGAPIQDDPSQQNTG